MRVDFCCDSCSKSSVCKYKDEQTKFAKELKEKDIPGVYRVNVECHYYSIDLGVSGTHIK